MRSLSSSFRDPDGFLFSHENRIYRQVNLCFAESFDRFIESGLYEDLTKRGYLVAHNDVTTEPLPRSSNCHRILAPELIPYISYPYEWSFSQLKAAAMLTLRVQTIALKYGFTLKDASAYNVQFRDGAAIFIDTLSFEIYEEGSPWVGYRQFCQHFLSPLALMSFLDVDLGKLMVSHLDGVPLSLASKLLPWRTHLSLGIQTHIHFHARMQSSHADEGATGKQARTSGSLTASSLQAIVESLAATVRKLEWKPVASEWGDYYAQTNYSDHAIQAKRDTIDKILSGIDQPLRIIHDLGANTGQFSRIATKHCDLVVSQDIDPVAVESNFRQLLEGGPKNVLPLRQDLFSPSPAIGWGNTERDSFVQRARCDLIMALALVHHLAISNNTPLEQIAELFCSLSDWLIIEFVPKTDSQVKRLLSTRRDIFPDYDERGFELAFRKYYEIQDRVAVEDTDRTVYLMRRK